MKANIGYVLAAAGLVLAMVVDCPADLIIPAPVRTLIAVTPDGGDDGAGGNTATTALTLEFDQPVANLTKDDIILNPGGGQYLLAAERLEQAADNPKTYTLWIKPVCNDGAVTIVTAKDITVTPVGIKDYIILKGGPYTLTVYFLPLWQAIEERKLTAVTADGGAAAATTALTLEFDQPVANLTKDDIILNSNDAQYLLAAERLEQAADNPKTYTLWVKPVCKDGAMTAVTPHAVTVTPTGMKDYIKLNGSHTVTVYFLPVWQDVEERKLTAVTADGDAAAATAALTLEFDQPVANLTKDDIILNPGGGQYLLAAKGLTAAGAPNTYLLAVEAIYKNSAVTTVTSQDVTVTPVDIKDYIRLTGSQVVTVYFQPVTNSRYNVFKLEQVIPDGHAAAPITPSSKLTLRLSAAAQAQLPDLIADDIIIEPLTTGLTLDKGTISAPIPAIIEGRPGRIWELAVSRVNKTGMARISIIKEGYLQENSPLEREFYGFGVDFLNAEEDAPANDGQSTSVILEFSVSIPGLAADNIHVTPYDIAVTGVSPIPNKAGKYRLNLRWGAVENWSHTAQVKIIIDGYVVSPAEQQVFLSMRKIDSLAANYEIALRRTPAGKFKRDGQIGSISVLDKAYWMGETEVTNKLWEAVMGYNPGSAILKDDNYPVNKVTWIEAIVFCNKLSIKAGRQPVYSVNVSYNNCNGGTTAPITGVNGWENFKVGTGFRSAGSDWPANNTSWRNDWISVPATPPAGIPSIAYNDDTGLAHHYEAEYVSINPAANGYRLPAHHQWMWAAMGADMSPAKLDANGVNVSDKNKPFAGFNRNNDIADYVWFTDNVNDGNPRPVGTKKPNELGIYDLSGNVCEWCYDQWTAYQPWFPAPGGPVYFVPNPMRDDDHYFADARKVLKGGSYASEVGELSFGYYSLYIREMDNTKWNEDQGLRVMRWVQPGE